MASRSPAPGRYSWLEWGPREPGAGGGSQVRDAVGAPIRTGNRVADIGRDTKVGCVMALDALDVVRVAWSSDHPDAPTVLVDPATLRVIG